jgi:hypothetical protein
MSVERIFYKRLDPAVRELRSAVGEEIWEKVFGKDKITRISREDYSRKVGNNKIERRHEVVLLGEGSVDVVSEVKGDYVFVLDDKGNVIERDGEIINKWKRDSKKPIALQDKSLLGKFPLRRTIFV